MAAGEVTSSDSLNLDEFDILSDEDGREKPLAAAAAAGGRSCQQDDRSPMMILRPIWSNLFSSRTGVACGSKGSATTSDPAPPSSEGGVVCQPAPPSGRDQQCSHSSSTTNRRRSSSSQNRLVKSHALTSFSEVKDDKNPFTFERIKVDTQNSADDYLHIKVEESAVCEERNSYGLEHCIPELRISQDDSGSSEGLKICGDGVNLSCKDSICVVGSNGTSHSCCDARCVADDSKESGHAESGGNHDNLDCKNSITGENHDCKETLCVHVSDERVETDCTNCTPAVPQSDIQHDHCTETSSVCAPTTATEGGNRGHRHTYSGTKSAFLLKKKFEINRAHSEPNRSDIVASDSLTAILDGIEAPDAAKESNSLPASLPAAQTTRREEEEEEEAGLREERLKTIVKRNCCKFVEWCNWDTLLAGLTEQSLLDESSTHKLMSENISRTDKANYFILTVLPSKGRDAYTRFCKCVCDEMKHSGHRSLQELICT